MFLKIPARRSATLVGDLVVGEISFHRDQVVCISKMRCAPSSEDKDPTDHFSIELSNDKRYIISEEIYKRLLCKLHPEELVEE